VTIFSVQQDSSLKHAIHSSLAIFLSVAAFIVPASSVNYPSGLYTTAVFLVISSFLFLFYRTESELFSRLEKIMLVSWLVYPVVTALDLWFRVGWIWIEFQEPSRFLLVLPIFLIARRGGVCQDMLKWGVFAGALASAAWGYYQKIHLGVYRAEGGTSGLIAIFGDIGLMLGVLSVALFQPQWRLQKRWLSLALFGLFCGVFASLASGTKGGWISMPVLAWVMVDLMDNPTYKKRFAVLIGFVLAAFLVWFFVPFISARVNLIPVAIYEYFVNGQIMASSSAGMRLALWHLAAVIFWENPLFGTGPGSFNIQKVALAEKGMFPSIAILRDMGPHSQFLNSLYEQGVVGALMVYSIYVAFIFHCRSYLTNNKALATSGILLAVGFMDFGIAEVIWDINNAGVFFTLMMVLIAGKLSFDRSQVSLNPSLAKRRISD
jgi:O-antigen ligase